ncbi:hypothetical protein D9M72_492090 [compost metagenome]
MGIRPPRASMMPPTVAVTAKATLRITTSGGDEVTRSAAAAGVISRASTRSAPTTWMDSATLIPSSTIKPMPSVRTGTPRASATSGSTLAKVSGRQMATSAIITTRAAVASTCS